MKYFIIAGEASGDLHASNLMEQIKKMDVNAQFQYFGGDKMKEQGGILIRHYKKMSFMGFISVAKNLDKIFENFNLCKTSITQWQPDIVILVDYPGFNLKVAKFVKETTKIPVHYYISPKLWAWKEYRVRSIKKYVDRMYTIFPFETDFYKKYGYNVTYVGNPILDSIESKKKTFLPKDEFLKKNGLDERPIIAMLAGSRQQEINDSLPIMLSMQKYYPEYQFVLAGMEILRDNYKTIQGIENVKIVYEQTYDLLNVSFAALVTSGTATLETAILRIPQVVCYHVKAGKLGYNILKKMVKIPYVSLVNIISRKEVVKELLGPFFTEENLKIELDKIVNDTENRNRMLQEYDAMIADLGMPGASRRAAIHITSMFKEY